MPDIVDTMKAVEEEVIGNLKRELKEKDNEIAALNARIKEMEEKADIKENEVVCLRCGRLSATKPVEIKEDVLRNYFRAMLGQRLFSQTLSMFDGMLRITFKEMSGDALRKQDSMLKNIEKEADYLEKADRSFLVCTLAKVETYDKEAERSTVLYEQTDEQLSKNIDTVGEAYEVLCSKLGQLQVSLIRKAGSVFAMLMTALVNKAQDENFYEGAGLL